jgi:PKD repeat protein
VNVRPLASFGADRTEADSGEDVLFTANGSWDDSGLTGYLFDFGDGTESGWTEDTWAVHRYMAQGSYEPRLMVRDADGADSDWSAPLTISVKGRSLDIGLSADRTFVDSQMTVTFSASARNSAGNITDYLWDFGDGSTDYGRNASRVEHVYQRPGAFSVSVRMTDSTGSNGTATLSIVVRNRLPVASFTFSPDTPTVLTEVAFGSTSADPDGSVVRWLWDFGDGTQNWGPAPTHLYMDDGCYTVILAVLDDSGSWSAPALRELRLHNLPPKARATVTPQMLRVGQLALLDGSPTADPDDAAGTLLFCWSSQEGWRSEGPKLSRRFDAPGKYVVRLSVTDDDGATDSVDITFDVREKGTIVPGLDYRPAAFGLLGLAAMMFLLTFLARRKVRAAAPPAGRPSPKRNGRQPNSVMLPKK